MARGAAPWALAPTDPKTTRLTRDQGARSVQRLRLGPRTLVPENFLRRIDEQFERQRPLRSTWVVEEEPRHGGCVGLQNRLELASLKLVTNCRLEGIGEAKAEPGHGYAKEPFVYDDSTTYGHLPRLASALEFPSVERSVGSAGGDALVAEQVLG